jgi:hypothetical protein
VTATYQGLILPNLMNNKKLFIGENSILEKSAAKLNSLLSKENLIKRPVNIDNLFHPEFINSNTNEN